MGKKNFSRRAELLKRVLKWIDSEKYQDWGKFMVFGETPGLLVQDRDNDDAEFFFVPLSKGQKISELYAAVSKSCADFERAEGRRLAQGRTSLDKQEASHVEAFVTDLVKLTAEIIKARGQVPKARPGTNENVEQQEASTTDDFSDSLDSHYSDEVLSKLERIVPRASLLDRVEAGKVPSESVEAYFEEAHQCFLYGFPIATAVLCRAILEARLTELSRLLDPDERLKQKIAGSEPQKRLSYLKELINRAAAEGLLEEVRPLIGRRNDPHWAEEIIDAGNWAIHNLDKFGRKYGGDEGSKLTELLAITRKAVIQLLAKQKGEQGS